jgi:alpha/beta superfamily hydrolase
VGAVRFDFTTSDAVAAGEQARGALDHGTARWPHRPAIMAGYSFGAGVAASVDDGPSIGWYLLAPQATALLSVTIGADARPKRIAVPEHDQYSPPADVKRTVSGWRDTTVTVVPGVDHFLGAAVASIVDDAITWIATRPEGSRPSPTAT